jgi:hypothetical protein
LHDTAHGSMHLNAFGLATSVTLRCVGIQNMRSYSSLCSTRSAAGNVCICHCHIPKPRFRVNIFCLKARTREPRHTVIVSQRRQVLRPTRYVSRVKVHKHAEVLRRFRASSQNICICAYGLSLRHGMMCVLRRGKTLTKFTLVQRSYNFEAPLGGPTLVISSYNNLAHVSTTHAAHERAVLTKSRTRHSPHQ